jgi:signal transduction histidine kinase
LTSPPAPTHHHNGSQATRAPGGSHDHQAQDGGSPGKLSRGLLGSIRARLLTLVLLTSLPLLALFVFRVLEARTGAIADAERRLQTMLKIAADDIAATASGAEQLLAALVHVPAVSRAEPGNCGRLLGSLLKEYRGYANLFVALPTGDVVCSAVPLPTPINIKDRPYFAEIMQSRRPAFGRATIGRVVKRAILPAAHPILDDKGRVVAIVGASIELATVVERFARKEMGPNLTFTVRGSDGIVLARFPDNDKWTGQAHKDSPVTQTILKTRHAGTTEAIGIDGINRIFGILPVFQGQAAELWLVSGMAKDGLLAEIDRTFVRDVAWLVFIVLLIGLGAWLLGDVAIRRPVVAILMAARRIRRHEYDARIGGAYPSGELGELSRSFDEMADAMQRYVEDIRRLNSELEQRVRERTAQLEATNKELESFSYSVSHDLRAPLRAIDGFSMILEEDYMPRLDDEGKRVLSVIRRNSQNMGRLIDDLLMFSRLGRLDVSFGDIDMNQLTDEVLAELQLQGARQWPAIVRDRLPPARADRTLLRQVWMNLLSNAIKFSTAATQPRIDIGAHIKAGECIYHVRDNGAGFDMRYYDKLFGVFQRLHSADEYPGTGVGLAIVQRIIARHGGRVWAEAAVNAGATFYFSLPTGERRG